MQIRTMREAAIALLVTSLLASCSGSGPEVVVHTASGRVRFTVEVAADDAARTQGLMWRRDLARGHGMLFVFPDEREHSFWMKNTFIPLDMIFIAADRRIAGIHANATPQSTTPVTVGKPSRWVLEIAAGEAKRLGLTAGDRVDLPDTPGR